MDDKMHPNRSRLNSAQAAEALHQLHQWMQTATPEEIKALNPQINNLQKTRGQNQSPTLSNLYPADFVADQAYCATLPDLQNTQADSISGKKQHIQHVGISNFCLPVLFETKDGAPLTVKASVTGTISLEANIKGINMSRIMRSFYKYSESVFSFDVIDAVLDAYEADIGFLDARIQMHVSLPQLVKSLRSNLSGYQYYDLALEMVDRSGARKRILHFDYVYSSTCPCSLALSEHARTNRGQLATAHSQRSVARISIVLNEAPEKPFWFEDIIELCRKAVPTEVQVMVKREDEQAFAELNAANPIFVEDAVRLFSAALKQDSRIGDFRIVASHQESLHSHDAVSVLTEGDTFSSATLEPRLFPTLIHTG